ncbi:FAD-binding oxidoreductase [Rhodococcus chondri]|uniref:nitric oxide dioxygenase n=1 Tax=Rhodococcus chondri TaxID=3065941 RepID=A0ABU7JPS9_9NOCA|nr:FAD-binding oxidoreductase [Rhodococcus sp. CC-R104]MEE2031332.1 FAD-binding oxidoreductase [Rhodococcus sp. CC-R104]
MEAFAIARVQLSFASITATPTGPERFATAFYTTLWAEAAGTRDLFPAGMEGMRHRFTTAVGWVINRLTDVDAVEAFLGQLARDHRKYGVRPDHFRAAGHALLVAVRECTPLILWTAALERTWSRVIGRLVEAMAVACEEDDLPASWGATVVGHERVLPDLAIIRLETDSPIPFHAGQYMSVQIPQRPNMWRYLSAAIPPNPHGQIEFHVRRVSTGWVSPALVGEVSVGDRWTIGPPLGGLAVDLESGQDALMIASGTGLAPMRAQIMEMAMRGNNPRVHLFYGGQYPCDLYDLETLWHIAMTNPWLTIVPVIEQPENPWWHPFPPKEAPPGLNRPMYGKLGKVAAQFGTWADRQIQIAGSPSMIRTTLYALSAAGTPRQNIRFDPL